MSRLVVHDAATKAVELDTDNVTAIAETLPTHDATVGLPVFDNDQDIARLQSRVSARWQEMAEDGTIIPPGYLIRGHGVYVWAADMDGALARLEALEFMLGCELIAQSRGGMFE